MVKIKIFVLFKKIIRNKKKMLLSFQIILLLLITKTYEMNSTIKLTINGTGNQEILSNINFNYQPIEIYIDGEQQKQQNKSDYFVYNLTNQINNITLILIKNLQI